MPKLLFVIFFATTNLVNLYAQEVEDFALVREEDSISIYERWIKFPGTDPPQDAREVKGVFVVHSSFKEVVRMLRDPKWVMKSQKHVSEFKVYPLPVDTAWLEYSYHDIPWPVSDQDHFLVYKIEHHDENGMFITFESTPNAKLAPVRSGVDRMNLLGSWTLEKLTDGKIKASYRIISEPSNIPRIFTDPIIRRNMVTTIKSMIKILEEEDI
ncbi:MAG: hypothetical protein R2820_16250 [Cyclobacteriaceae bacterium]|nr:hypothetical protein [Cyclobacteriaceae bacterium]